MSFSIRSVHKKKEQFSYSFRRDTEPKVVSCYEQRLRSGTKYYCQFFSDGTAKFGKYDKDGNWSRVMPDLINDFFGFIGEELLYEDFITVNQDCIGITVESMQQLREKLHLDDVCRSLITSRKLEWRPSIAG